MTQDQIRAIVLAVMCAFTAAVSTYVTRAVYQAKISVMERDYEADKRRTAEANTKALADAQLRADDAIKRLAESERIRLLQSQENQREIKRLTTGRPVFSGELVRLLNGTVSDDQHQAIGSAAATDAGFATDTDIANWIDTARLYYGRCQDRVNEIRRFFEGDARASRNE